MDFKPGIYPNITRAEYDSVIALNQSSIKLIEDRHVKAAWSRLHNPDPPSLAMIEGLAFHMLLLEPGRFEQEFVAKPAMDMRTKIGRADRERWEAENPGFDRKTEITYDRMIELQNQVHQLLEHPVVSRWVNAARMYEFAVLWEHPEHGFPCKALMDVISVCDGRTIIWDPKTTREATAEFWRKEIANRSYLIQDEWYRQGLNAIAEADRDFVFVAVETKGFKDVALFETGSLTRFEAQHRIRRACAKWARALETGIFPGPTTTVQQIEVPRWAMTHERDYEQEEQSDGSGE